MSNFPAKEKQVKFLEALFAEREFDGIVSPVADLNGLTKKEASDLISALLKCEKKQGVAKVGFKPAEKQEFHPGQVFLKDGVVFRVNKSQSTGYLYAKKLVVSLFNQKGSWVYAKGALAGLVGLKPVSLEQAKQFGVQTGVCCICGRTLTVQESVEKGIGPVCESKMGEW